MLHKDDETQSAVEFIFFIQFIKGETKYMKGCEWMCLMIEA